MSSRFQHLAREPRFVVLALSVLQLIFVFSCSPDGGNGSFWETAEWDAILLLIAATLLYYARPISLIPAMYLSGRVAVEYAAWIINLFRDNYGVNDWWIWASLSEFHPDYVTQFILSAVIFGVGTFYLLRRVRRKGVVLP